MNNESNKSIVEDLQPSSKKIDAEALLDKIEDYISKHAILPKGASTAITLWCLATYNINIFRIFPKLALHSPEKRCGKSTVLDLIEAFSCKSFIVSNITTAAVFRVIEECQPTLIIDEADTFIAGRADDMVGIINSGHAKNRASVIRCTGEDNKPTKFSTWTPMVLASIKQLQSTIMDRSVVIPLRRKTLIEKVKRIDHDICELTKPERQDLLKWSIDNDESLKANPIEPPNLGNDRAVDNWMPLFTIANQVSIAWLKKCELSYQLLNDYDDEPLASTLLLEDIRKIFIERNDSKISSADLVEKLVSIEDHPWGEWKSNRPISQNILATILKPYGIKPKGIRFNGHILRGYEVMQFKEAFNRYLPEAA